MVLPAPQLGDEGAEFVGHSAGTQFVLGPDTVDLAHLVADLEPVARLSTRARRTHDAQQQARDRVLEQILNGDAGDEGGGIVAQRNSMTAQRFTEDGLEGVRFLPHDQRVLCRGLARGGAVGRDQVGDGLCLAVDAGERPDLDRILGDVDASFRHCGRGRGLEVCRDGVLQRHQRRGRPEVPGVHQLEVQGVPARPVV